MIPFQVDFKPGHSPFRQTVFAVRKALVRGELKPGERFPSVRTLSQELRINPNTAHKIVAELVREGILEVRTGIGTVVRSHAFAANPDQDPSPLHDALESLVVEARSLGLGLAALQQALERSWQSVVNPRKQKQNRSAG